MKKLNTLIVAALAVLAFLMNPESIAYDVRSVGSDGLNGHEFGTNNALQRPEIGYKDGTGLKRWMGMTERIDYLEAAGGKAAGQIAFDFTDLRHSWDIDYTPFYEDLKIAHSGYQSCFHCDRKPNESHSNAYLNAMAWIRFAIAKAVYHSDKGNRKLASIYIAVALHTAQDLSTHSNIVDLEEPEWQQIRNSITADFSPGTTDFGKLPNLTEGLGAMKKSFSNSKISLPDGLKITGYDINGEGQFAYFPQNDKFDYPHGETAAGTPAAGVPGGVVQGSDGIDGGFSKDTKDTKEGRSKNFVKDSIGAKKGQPTKYYAARFIGADFSADILATVKKRTAKGGGWEKILSATAK